MTTLLDKALSVTPSTKTDKKINAEMIDLAIAWAQGKINNQQAQTALGWTNKSAPFYSRMACALREAFRQGKIKQRHQ